jgi:hypothetical protein
MSSTFRLFSCLLLLVFSAHCFSDDSLITKHRTTDSPATNKIKQPLYKLEALAKKPQWLHLLHYHQAGLFSRFESQADDPDFFFSKEGKTKPLSELKATIAAFENSTFDDDSAICQFPARYAWIQAQLGNKQLELALEKCQEYQQWQTLVDAENLTLVFPAAYLNSPSSMFGHTFIRIDRASGNNSLLDYSVNYAANADPDDNELVFTYKGLSGGYPGVFSILPYYQKVKEYSFLESRDVWEYKLSLSPSEVQQFVRHVWEIRNSHFDYYFFTENCSYHLLTILDAASARFSFADQFHLSVKPSDTVRVIEQSGLVESSSFRPATLSKMSHKLKQLDQDLIAKAKELVESELPISELLNTLSSEQQAQSLELAYQYSRYLAVRKKQTHPNQGKRTIQLLSARSKLPETKVFSDIPTPAYRDDQGHDSHRFESQFGHDGNQDFTQIGLRMAYHDHLDNAPGYIKGAKLEMFNLQFRHTLAERFFSNTSPPKARSKTRLHALKLIDIASYTPRNTLIKPISWHVSTGLKRHPSEPDELSTFLSGGGGLSYQWGYHQFYALADLELNADNDIEKGFRIAAGPHIGWLSQHETWSTTFEFTQLLELAGARFKSHKAELGLSKSLSKNWQLRLKTSYQQFDAASTGKTEYQHIGSMGILYYF